METNTNLYILDSSMTTVGILSNRMPFSLPFYDDLQERDLDDFSDTLTLSVPANHEKAIHVIAGNFILYPTYGGEYKMYRIVEVTETSDSNQYFKKIYAEISAQDDLIKDVVRPTTFTSVPLEDVLEHITIGTAWTVGSIDDLGVQDVVIEDYPTKLEAIINLVKQYGGELEFEYESVGTTITKQKISVYEQLGNATGKPFMHSKDILGVERIEDRSKIVTALIGVGKTDDKGTPLTFMNANYFDNLPKGYTILGDAVGSEKALESYSRNGEHIFGVFKDDSATSPQELFENTLKALQQYERPQMTYKVTVALLERLAGYEHERVSLGDTILVQDKSVQPELYLKARVRKLSRSLTNPANDAVELGDYIAIVPPVNEKISQLQKKISEKEELWNKAEEIPAMQNAISLLPTKEDLFSTQAQRLKVRYIRDYINGSDVDATNQWSELQVFKEGKNIAKGLIPTGSKPLTNASYLTDDIVDSARAVGTDSGLQYVQLDLGEVHENVEYVKVWHNISGGRTYNQHMVDVSEDGSTWVRLYNSDRHGSHTESTSGFIVPVNSSAILENQANTVSQIVSDMEDVKEFKQSAEYELEQKVNLVDYNETVNSINKSIAEKAGLEYVDGKLQAKADNSAIDEISQSIAEKAGLDYVEGQLRTKANSATTYTKTEVDNAVNSKVSTVTYNADKNGIVGRLDVHDTAIEQNEKEIALKASQSTVDNIAGTVEDVQAQLSVQAGQIATKVESTTYEAGISGAKSYADTKASQAETNAKNASEKAIVKANTAPSSPTSGQLWLNTSVTPNQLQRWSGTAWTKVTPTTASEVGAYTKSETDTKNTATLNSAKADATSKANQAEANAKGYTDDSLVPVVSRLETAETNITQTKESINLMATKATVDTINTNLGKVTTRVSTAEGSINTMAGQIALKANQSTVDTLAGTVSSHTGTLNVLTDKIESKVEASDVEDIARRSGNEVVKARYVRVYANGSSFNSSNYIVELMVMQGDTNLAKGKTPTSSATLTNPTYITNEVYTNSDLYSQFGSGRQWLQVDLGAVYEDVDFIKLYMYYKDSRITYGLEVQVSEDAVNWTKLYDSELDGRFKTTGSGFVVLVNQQKVVNSMSSSIKQTADAIESKVEKNGIVSAINQSPESIKISANKIDITGAVTFSSFDSSTQTKINNAESTANTAKTTADAVKSTVDTNKSSWDTAYSRVNSWTVSGKTTINGGLLETNTVLAKHIAIGDFTNYVADPVPTGTSNWITKGNVTFVNATNPYLQLGGTSDIVSPVIIDVKEGDKFYLEATLINSGTITGTFGGFRVINSDTGVDIGSANINPSGRQSWIFTVPSGVKRIQFRYAVALTAGLIGIYNMIMRRMVSGELIVDGSISSQHIKANRLEGVTIVSSANNTVTQITGGKIQSDGSFTRDFGSGQSVTYKSTFDSGDGVVRVGIESKNYGGVERIGSEGGRALILTDKTLTSQRAIHSGSSDKKGARFIDFFADETVTSGVQGGGMHIYSGQSLVAESQYSLELRSRSGYVLIEPEFTDTGNNYFKFEVADNQDASKTDGLIQYGSPTRGYATEIRMGKAFSERLIEFNQVGTSGGTANIKADTVYANSITPKGGSLKVSNIYFNTSNSLINDVDNMWLQSSKTVVLDSSNSLGARINVGYDSTKSRVWSAGIYERTYSSGPTMCITSEGTLGRISSSIKYKIAVEEVDTEELSERLLTIKPKSWFDKTASEAYAAYLTKIKKGIPVDITDEDIPYLDRHFGMIAEDLVDAGLEMFVQFGKPDENGERHPEGINYDRVWTLLIPLVKKQKEQIASLEERLARLEERVG